MTLPARSVCRACSARYAGLIDEACAVCGGYGYLILGAGRVAADRDVVVARTVEMVLGPAIWKRAAERTAAMSDTIAALIDAGFVEAVPVASRSGAEQLGDADKRRVGRAARKLAAVLKQSDPVVADIEVQPPPEPSRPDPSVAEKTSTNVLSLAAYAGARKTRDKSATSPWR
jgi:hypothetical protein